MSIQTKSAIVEVQGLKIECSGLDDESLIDEIGLIMGEMDVEHKVEGIVLNFFNTGKLSIEHRLELESLYILAYAHLGIDV